MSLAVPRPSNVVPFPTPHPRRRKLLCWTFAFPFFVFYGVAFLLLGFLPLLLECGVFDGFIQKQLSAVVGGTVSFRKVSFVKANQLTFKEVRIEGVSQNPITLECARLDAQWQMPFLPWKAPSLIVVSDFNVRINSDWLAWRRDSSQQPQNYAHFELPDGLRLPQIELKEGTVSLSSGEKIEHLQGALKPWQEGSHTFRLTGRQAQSFSQDVELLAFITSEKDRLSVELHKLQVGDFKATLAWAVEPNSSHGKLQMQSFYLPSPLQGFLKQALGLDCRGMLSCTSAIEFSQGEITKLQLEGLLDHYHVTFSNIDLLYQKEPSQFKLQLDRETPLSPWKIQGELTKLDVEVPENYRAKTNSIRFELGMMDKETGRHIEGRIYLQGIAFSEKTSPVEISSPLTATLNIDLTSDPTNMHWDGRIALEPNLHELLFREFYQDLSKQKVAFSWEGSVDLGRGEIQTRQSRLDLAGVGALATRGTVSIKPEGVFTDLTFEAENLQMAQLPDLLRLDWKVTSGIFNGEGRFLRTPSTIQAAGSLQCRDASLAYGDIFRVEKLNAEVPFRFHYPEQAGEAEFSKAGLVSFERLEVSNIFALEPQQLRLFCTTNGFKLEKEWDFTMAGGSVRLGQFKAEHVLSLQQRVETSLQLSHINIEQLSALLHFPQPLAGTLHGYFPKLVLEADSLKAEGHLMAHAWGGVVRFKDISMDKPLTSDATVRFSADFEDIPFSNACDTFSNFDLAPHGIVNGFVNNLELYNGEPLQFELGLQAIPNEETAQKVSVRTIHHLLNISEVPLAQVVQFLGRAASPLTLRLTEIDLPNYLYYSHMGLYARMQRDEKIFIRGKYYRETPNVLSNVLPPVHEYSFEELRQGKIVKDAEEYIIVGTSFKQINVINLTPGGFTTYSTLKERIQEAGTKSQNKK